MAVRRHLAVLVATFVGSLVFLLFAKFAFDAGTIVDVVPPIGAALVGGFGAPPSPTQRVRLSTRCSTVSLAASAATSARAGCAHSCS